MNKNKIRNVIAAALFTTLILAMSSCTTYKNYILPNDITDITITWPLNDDTVPASTYCIDFDTGTTIISTVGEAKAVEGEYPSKTHNFQYFIADYITTPDVINNAHVKTLGEFEKFAKAVLWGPEAGYGTREEPIPSEALLWNVKVYTKTESFSIYGNTIPSFWDEMWSYTPFEIELN